MIRSASLTGYADVARAAGLEPLRMLRAAGLDRSCLDDHDIKIRAGAVRNLLEHSAEASGVEDFGLRLAAERNLSNLGPIGLIAREEPSVRQALESIGHYMRIHNESLTVRINVRSEVAIVSLDIHVGRPRPARQATELAVGVLHRIMRMFLGSKWSPDVVCFAHARPKSVAAHTKFFGSPIEFDHVFTGIVCHPRDLEAPIVTSDPVMARTARRYLDAMLERPHSEAKDVAREMICVLLPTGRCSAERVAVHMGITRRTLDRRLARNGKTFHDILEGVRAELCGRYMDSSARSLTDVANLLGFANLSSFSRWFRVRFGTKASAWSKRLAEPEGFEPSIRLFDRITV